MFIDISNDNVSVALCTQLSTFYTGVIQTELMSCCLGRKHQNLVDFWRIFNSYIYFSVDNDIMNNSGRYFICEVCNLENIVTKLYTSDFRS